MRTHSLALFGVLSPLLALACSSSSGASNPVNSADAGDAAPALDSGDPVSFAVPPTSCSYTCPSSSCAESTTPYTCPALGPWSSIPHDPQACGAWDGTYPAATPTKCTVSAPSGDAVRIAGPVAGDASAYILPDGRRVSSAGTEWIFNEPGLSGGNSDGLLLIPGTPYAVVIDDGDGPHVVRVVDTSKLGSGTNPVTSFITFTSPSLLNTGAVFVAPDLLLVPTDDGNVQAFTFDTTKGLIAKDATRTIALPPSANDTGKADNFYASALVVTADQKHLIVTPVFDTRVLVYDLTAGNYGKLLGTTNIDKGGTFACGLDPNDPTGQFLYCSVWGGDEAVEIDVSNPAAPKKTRTFALAHNPEGLAFLDGRWLAVTNDFGDSISLIDRVAGTVTLVAADTTQGGLHGSDPSSLAYDATHKRLYTTLAGLNAVAAWNVDTTQTPPTLTPAGRLPTSWWPSAVSVEHDGSLLVVASRGHSDGIADMPFPAGGGDGTDALFGGITHIPMPSAMDLTSGDAEVTANDNVGAAAGAPTVTCPNSENDFPVPPTNTMGASQQIKHIFFIVRENKTFDALLGDIPGANGSPALMMKTSSADMDNLWLNFRDLARTFAISDNYYTDAEVSAQGHVWTTFGRSSDFTERTWSLDGYGGRGGYQSPVQPQGFSTIGYPTEGSLFDWLGENHVDYTILGEGLGEARRVQPEKRVALDIHYPGGFVQSIGYPDVEKACYVAGEVRVLCDAPTFIHQTLPNDHTLGVSSTQASPETMIAINDEATGIEMDAIAHSPIWASSLIVVTEDDPADGGDHVERHRTPVLFVSPWIKRGYVSKTHIDVSSLHKLFANILGLPYNNALIANAGLPLDLFSETPDYTPYTYTPRKWPITCNVQPTLAEEILTGSWDFSRVDEQPGLDAQLFRYMRGQQLQSLTPQMTMAAEARVRARGVVTSP